LVDIVRCCPGASLQAVLEGDKLTISRRGRYTPTLPLRVSATDQVEARNH
jgi:hypothetical protein